MSAALTLDELHQQLAPLPAGTIAILETPLWPIPALRRDFAGERTIGSPAYTWQPGAVDPIAGYDSEFGNIFAERDEPVVYGLIRDGALLVHGEIVTTNAAHGWRFVHTDLVADARPGDIAYFGYPTTTQGDLNVMLALEGGHWVVSGRSYELLDDVDEPEWLSDTTAVTATVRLDLDWAEHRAAA